MYLFNVCSLIKFKVIAFKCQIKRFARSKSPTSDKIGPGLDL